MPNLIASYQKHQTITQLKKVFATLANGFKLMTADDVILPGYGEDCSNVTADNFLDTYITPYFKTIKTCTAADGNNCGYPDGHTWLSPDGTYKSMGMYDFFVNVKTAGVTLADGTFLLFYFRDSDTTSCHTYATIDLNGQKAPNTLGKDVFMVNILGNKATPFMFYYDNTTNENLTRACRNGGWGMHCLHKIISDGWEIKEDYPW